MEEEFMYIYIHYHDTLVSHGGIQYVFSYFPFLHVYTKLMVVVSLKLLWQASSLSLALLLSFLLFDLA